MIAFDTNYLVRHIVQDDPVQCRTVAEVIADETASNNTIHLLDLVLLETVWVLESIYGFDREALVHVLSALVEDAAFSFDNPAVIQRSLRRFNVGKADFADHFIAASAQSRELTLKTFDKRLRKDLG